MNTSVKASFFIKSGTHQTQNTRWAAACMAVAMALGGCSSTSQRPLTPSVPPVAPPTAPAEPVVWDADVAQAMAWADEQPLPPPIARTRSLWQPVSWTTLPGLQRDDWHQAWHAWVRSCERPPAVWQGICRELRPQLLGTPASQLAWMVRNLQPYRVVNPDGTEPPGLLTGYYEPVMQASRVRTPTHTVPLYGPPPRLAERQPWFSRRDIDTRPDVQAQLAGREVAWLNDPIDALILQIQGSGRVVLRDADDSERTVRLAFAGHNGHTYHSVGRWLLDQKAISDPSWAGIKTWAARNPERVNDMLWSNPRTVFFREEPLSSLDAQFGPRGAQGVPLTPERSIAVDPLSVPYGTPVWLTSSGPSAQLQRLVLAQDTGGAITGAVRADYFAGWGEPALALVGGLKQPLKMWALWPRQTR